MLITIIVMGLYSMCVCYDIFVRFAILNIQPLMIDKHAWVSISPIT